MSTSKSTSTLAALKSSLIAKVNHAAAIRRQRSSAAVGDVTSGDVTAVEVRRRRIRSPFSSTRVEPSSGSGSSKPVMARSSLADQRIIESVVFRASAGQQSAAAAPHRDVAQTAATGRRLSADVDKSSASSRDVGFDRRRQGVAVFQRSLSQGQAPYDDQAPANAADTTLVRSVSTNNAPFVNANFNDPP